jgi:hypothetical protein
MKRSLIIISALTAVALAGPVFNSTGVEVLKNNPLSTNSRGADSKCWLSNN